MATVHGVLVADGRLQEFDIEDNLDAYYKVLKCHTIDIVTRRIGNDVYDIVCDDEGLFSDAQISMMSEQDLTPMLVGNLFLCRSASGELCSLSEQDVRNIKQHWKHRVLWGHYC